jgi:cardiolipin synthase
VFLRYTSSVARSAPNRRQFALAITDPANVLTVVRLPLAGLLWIAPESRVWLVAVIAAAALTDVVDGRVARWMRARRGSTSRFSEAEMFGAWLDPVCDKLFVLSMVIACAFNCDISFQLAAMTIAREIILAPFAVAYYSLPSIRQALHLDFHSDWLGKATTVVQFTVVLSLLFYPRPAVVLAAVAGALGAVAALHYLRRGIVMARLEERSPIVRDVLRSHDD